MNAFEKISVNKFDYKMMKSEYEDSGKLAEFIVANHRYLTGCIVREYLTREGRIMVDEKEINEEFHNKVAEAKKVYADLQKKKITVPKDSELYAYAHLYPITDK